MNPNLIKQFGVALKTPYFERKLNQTYPIELNKLATSLGYIIHPDCCNKYVEVFLEDQKCNYNSTFYKSWKQIKDSDRFELFIDQVLHYASTYGTEFQGTPYTKNPDPINIEYTTYKVIMPITHKELYEKCVGLLCTDIALKNDLVKSLCEFICEYLEMCPFENFDINQIKVREALPILYDYLKIMPNDPIEIFKYILYKTGCETMIIKNQEYIDQIKRNNRRFDWGQLNNNQLKSLSSIFYRYKPLFLAFKNGNNNIYINKIRRYAKKYHNPAPQGFWQNVLCDLTDLDIIKNRLNEVNNFYIIRLLQSIKEKTWINASNISEKNLYIIRNGKAYFKNAVKLDNSFAEYYEKLYIVLQNELVKRLSDKKCVVKFPKYLNLACPTSEKNFIGNIPFGSSYVMRENNFIGCYWRQDWGGCDFDLSLVDKNNHKIGWNANFKDDNVLFSGDMTSADPEATELLYCKNGVEDSCIYVNNFYSHESNPKYKIIFGSQEITDLGRNYMVDPNCIQLEEMLTSTTRQQMIGYIKNSIIYFMNIDISNSNISGDSKTMHSIFKRKVETFVDLKYIFDLAGFEVYDPEKHEKCDLDLTDLNKDTLISLFK